MVGRKSRIKHEERKDPTIRRMRDKNAPKVPVNAYGRFLKLNMKNFRKENEKPNEANARIAAEWAKMSEEEKKPYKDEYLKARDEYYKQKEEYLKTPQSKAYQKIKSEKRKNSRKKMDDDDYEAEEKTPMKAGTSKDISIKSGIKIFTKEFLDYNKEQEKKLKTIRMQNNDIEQECGRINAHIDQMSEEIRQMRSDNMGKSNRIGKIGEALSTWRKTIMETLGKAKLLDVMKLDLQQSSLEDLAMKLEEVAGSKNTAENSRLQQSIKQALSGIRLHVV